MMVLHSYLRLPEGNIHGLCMTVNLPRHQKHAQPRLRFARTVSQLPVKVQGLSRGLRRGGRGALNGAKMACDRDNKTVGFIGFQVKTQRQSDDRRIHQQNGGDFIGFHRISWAKIRLHGISIVFHQQNRKISEFAKQKWWYFHRNRKNPFLL